MATNVLERIQISAPIQYPMPDDLPDDFNPEQIIYREFDSTGRPVQHFYVDVDKPTLCNSNVDIEAFVHDIALNGYHRNDPDAVEDKKLDIPVSRESYVILQLYAGSGYTFSRNDPGVTLTTQSPAPPANVYGRLRYVAADGSISAQPIPNCRLAFFAALFRLGDGSQPYKQGLNFNLETDEGIVTIIDPDIRHPGNGTA
jgi:hypothetical protein